MNQIPEKYQLKCDGCGEALDMRDASVLAHGWIEDGKIVCYTDVKITYASSNIVGEPIEWNADKTVKTDLN